MTAQLIRYGIVGVSNTALTFASYALGTSIGVTPVLAAALAFLAGAANGYRWNSRWTFGVRGGRDVILRYVLVQLLGAALSAAGVALFHSDLQLQHLVAEALVIPCVTVATFLMARGLVFSKPIARL